jgi:mono/diheme cytochrome c family protein
MKKANLKKAIATTSMFIIVFSLVSFISIQKGWVVPAADAGIKNPVKSDAASISLGKELFTKHCKMCHGEKGTGVGKMAEPSNFTTKEFKAQTDGAIFYKINKGFGKMPAYATKIADEKNRWSIVNYLKTM